MLHHSLRVSKFQTGGSELEKLKSKSPQNKGTGIGESMFNEINFNKTATKFFSNPGKGGDRPLPENFAGSLYLKGFSYRNNDLSI